MSRGQMGEAEGREGRYAHSNDLFGEYSRRAGKLTATRRHSCNHEKGIIYHAYYTASSVCFLSHSPSPHRGSCFTSHITFQFSHSASLHVIICVSYIHAPDTRPFAVSLSRPSVFRSFPVPHTVLSWILSLFPPVSSAVLLPTAYVYISGRTQK